MVVNDLDNLLTQISPQVKLERARVFFSKGYQVQLTVEKKRVKRGQTAGSEPVDVELRKALANVESTMKDMGIFFKHLRKNPEGTASKLTILLAAAPPPKEPRAGQPQDTEAQEENP